MLSSIAVSGRCWSALKPTNIVPCSVDRAVRHVAPEDLAELVLVGARDVRRRRACRRARRCRPCCGPMTRSCSRDRQRLPRRRPRARHFCSSRIDPPAPGRACRDQHHAPARRSATGSRVPSMKPVRSRSWWYGQLDVSSATDGQLGQRGDRSMRRVEDDVVRCCPRVQSTASCCVAGIV